MNVETHQTPLWDIVCIGPHASKWTNAKNVAIQLPSFGNFCHCCLSKGQPSDNDMVCI